MLASYQDLNSQLMTEGTVVIPQENIPLTPTDWQTLSAVLDNLEYENIHTGDTDESTSVKVFRVKKEMDEKIYHPQLLEIINSPAMKKYIAHILNIDEYIVERCQCHIYYEGDFVSKHQDNQSCRDFKYAFMILLDGEYEGGDFCVHADENGGTYSYYPQKNSLIITKCSMAHEVKKVTKGERKVIVGFLKFPPNTLN